MLYRTGSDATTATSRPTPTLPTPTLPKPRLPTPDVADQLVERVRLDDQVRDERNAEHVARGDEPTGDGLVRAAGPGRDRMVVGQHDPARSDPQRVAEDPLGVDRDVAGRTDGGDDRRQHTGVHHGPGQRELVLESCGDPPERRGQVP